VSAASPEVEGRFGRSTAEVVREGVGSTIPLIQERLDFWSSATPVDVDVPFRPEFSFTSFNLRALATSQVGYDATPGTGLGW
jgi:hypothetical protein